MSWESDCMPGCKQQAMTDAQPWFYLCPLLKCGKAYLENPGIISAAVVHVCKHTQAHTHIHTRTHARTHARTPLPVPIKDQIT